MANGTKKKPDPLAPFKRAVTLATRTLAASKSMNVVFGSDAPGYDGNLYPTRMMMVRYLAARRHAE